MSASLIPDTFPSAILKGDVVGRAFEGVQNRLQALFPETIFRHVILPPHATRRTWDSIIHDAPCVAVGLGSWKASKHASNRFVGDLSFPLAILQTLARPEDLYLGTDELRGIGVAGIMAAIAGGLNGWRLPNVGSCHVASIGTPDTADWFEERSVVVAVELVFDGVTLDNIEALAELEDFVAGNTSPQVKKESHHE